MANSRYEYVKDFETNYKCPPSNWIMVRIDGCHFHKFSADHEFEKPNDENALNLMNACAVAMLEHFPDIVFAYGFSDEYSFLLKDTTQLYERRESKILSLFVSYFTSMYVIKWREFFPNKNLNTAPYFDGRVVCYPRANIVHDYFCWRPIDCHINNQYNTCFWMLVKSGKTKKEAQRCLEGTETKDKNELLFQQFGINYDSLPAIFKKGSNVYREEVEEIVKFDATGNPITRTRNKVVVGHFDIIGPKFWMEHPYILKEMTTSRARWTSAIEKGLVDILIEYSDATWRDQNGWTTEGWNKVTKEFNEKFPDVYFTRNQIREHEKELKTNYMLIKELRNKTGVSWDSSRFLILTSGEVWKKLIQENTKVKKWQSNSFPLFDSLALLHDEEGRRNFISIPHNNEEEDLCSRELSSRCMASEDRDFEVLNDQFDVPPPSTLAPSPEPSSRKNSRNNTSQDSFSEITTKRSKDSGDRMAEAMEGYVEFKKADGKRKQARRDEFSISKCMEMLNDMDELTEDEVLKGADIFFDTNNRELFISISPRFRVSWIRKKIAGDI